MRFEHPKQFGQNTSRPENMAASIEPFDVMLDETNVRIAPRASGNIGVQIDTCTFECEFADNEIRVHNTTGSEYQGAWRAPNYVPLVKRAAELYTQGLLQDKAA